MLSRRLRLSLIAALSLSLGTAACDRPSSITDPVNNSAYDPQFGFGNGALKKKDLRLVNVTLTERDQVEVVIDHKGGIISLLSGGVTLVIPKNAVSSPTTFRLRVNVGPNVMLSATATSMGGVLDDVGSAGFKKPLTLYVSKFGATTEAGSQFFIGEKVGDTVVPIATKDYGSFLSATIRHFTDYVVVKELYTDEG